jgi:hypothetical protein
MNKHVVQKLFDRTLEAAYSVSTYLKYFSTRLRTMIANHAIFYCFFLNYIYKGQSIC